MRKLRRYIRRWVSSALGMQGYVDLWWTPQLPVIYVNNPKCGCSTVKNSLKHAQAARFRSEGRHGFALHDDPHVADDWLKRQGITDLLHGDPRIVISCARNPYTRALSAYLDKVANGDISSYRELHGHRPESFEAFLEVLTRTDPTVLDSHFCPQHVNLGLPNVEYDAIFYLENVGSLQRSLRRMFGDFELETFAPHSRSAQQKLQAFYTPRAIDLVQRLYADDFTYLGYSRDLTRATDAPGEYWTPRGIIPLDADTDPAPAGGLASLRPVIRFHHLVEARII
jgi:hypothetical protein